jgi:futalosine hydrolase
MTEFLILVPTPTELNILAPRLQNPAQRVGGTLHLCGFGPVSAAARTSQLIAEFKPAKIILVGIAGAIGESLSMGAATVFDEVACFGIGVGSGEDFRTANNLGWSQWDSGSDTCSETRSTIGDVLRLQPVLAASPSREHAVRRQLLSCCSASAGPDDVALKVRHFPNAVAEDMEAFGVAMAASLMDIPVQVVRGISNKAGDRRLSQWKINEALVAAADVVHNLIAGDCSAG